MTENTSAHTEKGKTMNRAAKNENGQIIVQSEEVYRQYYDSAGNYHWFGVMTGHHVVRLDGSQMERKDNE